MRVVAVCGKRAEQLLPESVDERIKDHFKGMGSRRGKTTPEFKKRDSSVRLSDFKCQLYHLKTSYYLTLIWFTCV